MSTFFLQNSLNFQKNILQKFSHFASQPNRYTKLSQKNEKNQNKNGIDKEIT